MSFVVKVLRGLFSLVCGPSNEEPQDAGPRITVPSRPSQPHPQKRLDPNIVNQHNEHYMSLRAQANQEGDLMAKCFDSSHTAYSSGDGARAKQLSNEGKEHQKTMVRLNMEASSWIFTENNKDSKPGEIDLHGLYVKEAIAYTDKALREARDRGDSEMRLIVGKGLHSSGGAAKIKPAIAELMEKYQLAVRMDEENTGVLIVELGGERREIDAEQVAQGLERKDEGCIVM